MTRPRPSAGTPPNGAPSAIMPSAIMIIEDDPDHARIARIVLEAMAPGVLLAVCRDREEAAAALDDLPRGPLVLMDRLLYGVETFDAITWLRTRRPDARVVMLSALLDSVDRAYAIACGAADAIEKPSTLAGWRTTLGALVARLDPPHRDPIDPTDPVHDVPRAA